MSDADQQQLYNNGRTVAQWLTCSLPNDVIVQKVEMVLVSPKTYLTWQTQVLIKTFEQSESIKIAQRAQSLGNKVHIPRILLSASIEYQASYSQDPQTQPQLQHISPDDSRLKEVPWLGEEFRKPSPEIETGRCLHMLESHKHWNAWRQKQFVLLDSKTAWQGKAASWKWPLHT